MEPVSLLYQIQGYCHRKVWLILVQRTMYQNHDPYETGKHVNKHLDYFKSCTSFMCYNGSSTTFILTHFCVWASTVCFDSVGSNLFILSPFLLDHYLLFGYSTLWQHHCLLLSLSYRKSSLVLCASIFMMIQNPYLAYILFVRSVWRA